MKSLSELTSVMCDKINQHIDDLLHKVLDMYLERPITAEEYKQVELAATFYFINETTWQISFNKTILGSIKMEFPLIDAIDNKSISISFIPNPLLASSFTPNPDL